MSNRHQSHNRQSLQEVMNMMAARVEAIRPQAAARGALSEAEAYAAFDPLLGQLLKQYRDAQNNHATLLARYGVNDAMVALAADMVAGNDQAVETRLSELRMHETIRRMAQARMRESLEQISASARYQEKLANFARNQNALRERLAQGSNSDAYFWGMMLMWIARNQNAALRYFSLAQNFSVVSTNAQHNLTAA